MADEHEWDPELYISPTTLTRRLDSLERLGCAVLPFDEAVARLYEGTLPPRAVTLTFDDGFYDFSVRALPLLEARGYPATVYVTTQRCDRDPTVAHLLTSYMFWKHRQRGNGSEIGGSETPDVPSGRMHPEDEVAFAREALERLGIDCLMAMRSRVLSVMTPAELADVSKRGVAVEMHTHRHSAPHDPDEFITEVLLNRSRIESMTGQRPRHLCYPSGIHRPSYLSRLAAQGVKTATTCDPALASPSSHRLLLPRFVDSEACSQLAFEAWVTGVAVWLPRRTRRANAGN